MRHSFISTFTTEETKGDLLKSVISWGISLAAGVGVVTTLGWTGWIDGVGKNTYTYLAALVSGLILRFFTNIVIAPSSLYFETRGVSDKLDWGDVKSSVWKEPANNSIMVGLKLERDESHSVQYLRAVLQSVVKDGKILFKNNGECLIPIRKEDGSNAWMKSFDHARPRSFLLASVVDKSLQIRIKVDEEEKIIEYKIGTYDVVINFMAEGGVKGHLFKGILSFDGKSVELKRRNN